MLRVTVIDTRGEKPFDRESVARVTLLGFYEDGSAQDWEADNSTKHFHDLVVNWEHVAAVLITED